MREYIYFGILFVSIYFLIFSFRKPFITFYFLLVFFPFIFGFRALIGFEKFPLARVINILFFLIILWNYYQSKSKLPYNDLKFVFILFLIFGIISSLLGRYPGESVLRLLTYVEPLFWFFITYYAFSEYGDIKLLKKFFISIIIGFFLFLAYGAIEFITQNNYLIDKGILLTDPEQKYIEEIRFFNSGRLSSTLGQPVYASIFALFNLILLLFATKLFTKKFKFVLYLIIIGGILFIFLSGTRASIIGLLIFLLVFSTIKYKINYKYLMFFIIIISITIYSFSYLFPKESYYILSSFDISGQVYTESNTNFLFRIDLTLNFLLRFLSNIFFGIGPGVIQKSFFLYGDYSFYGFTGIENQYATLLLENGILGTMTYLIFLFLLIKKIKPTNSNKYNTEIDLIINELYYYILSIFITLMIIAFTVSIFTHITMYYLYLFLGIILGIKNNKNFFISKSEISIHYDLQRK